MAVPHYGAETRLRPFLITAQHAVAADLPDLARKIIDDALAYAETLPDVHRRTVDVNVDVDEDLAHATMLLNEQRRADDVARLLEALEALRVQLAK